MAGLTTAAIIGGSVALAGGISSGISAATKQNPRYNTDGINSVQLQGPSALGSAGQSTATDALGSMQGLRNDPSFSAKQDLATLLQQYSSNGGVPSATDTRNSQQYAASQFNPQQVALQQQFQQQQFQANQQAALSGRGVNDPILKARLAQSQAQQTAALSSQQTAFASQYANQLSQNRLGYAEGRANTLTQNYQQQLGLANNIFQIGLAAQSQDYNQRFGLYQQQLQTQENIAKGGFTQDQAMTTPGQRIGEGINGAISGVGAGLSVFGSLSGTKNPFATPASNQTNYANLYGAK